MGWKRGKFSVFAVVVQLVFLALFILFVRYDKEADASYEANSRSPENNGSIPEENSISHFYPMFQDVHIMMFIGFGYLMTFLKRYGYGSVGLNFFVASLVLQWATLMSGFLHLHDGKIMINITTMLYSEFAAAAVLISFGAVLGKTSPLQLLIMAICEIAIFQVNEWIGTKYFHAVDVGGSMFVHVFGAYFGITVAKVIGQDSIYKSPATEKQSSTYTSDLFSMIGTIFLWCYWPSFNSAVASPGDDQHRAVLNTYYSLASCTIATFLMCSILDKEDKYTMEYIQNCTLAGGVAVGTVADLMIQPWGAMLIGMVSGVVSVLGLHFLSPFLTSRLRIHDTCGVNNLHGMPGIIAGIGGIIACYMASEKDYGLSLYQIFPQRAPRENTTALIDMQSKFDVIEAGEDWSAATQAAYQAAALGLSLGMGIVGGIIVGLIMKIPIWDQPQDDDVHDDEPFWNLPEEGYPHVFMDGVMLPNKGDNPAITDPHINGMNEVTVRSSDVQLKL